MAVNLWIQARWAVLACIVSLSGCGGSSSAPLESTEVVLLRDAWGVPHVYAPTDRAAFYGLGWAAAEDRLFQMLHARLMAHGRMAEFFGPGYEPGQGDTYLTHDIEARRLGWRRHALATAAALDGETHDLLAAYAEGVNAYMTSPEAVLHPLIAQHALPLEEWRVEDCIAVWMRFADHFGSDGTEEVDVLDKWETLLGSLPFDEAYDEMTSGVVCDDEAAVVQPSDVSAAKQQEMADYTALHGLDAPGHCPIPLEAPKFSQALAVAGSRTYSGRAVLVGDPRSAVFRPSQFYEWSVEGATLSARGVGVAGSPNMFAGSSAHAAWSATALGMDQADLFELTTDPVQHPGQYLLDGQWRDFEVDEVETVHVLGEPSKLIDYRETVWGPVVTKLIDAAQPGQEFSVCRVPFHDAARDASVGSIRMLRAGDLDEFYAALADWSSPSINVVFADHTGRIGFAVAGDAPVRPGGLVLAGVIPQDGSVSANGWLEVLPHGLEPHVLDPESGVLHSANHMPIGSWYPIPVRFGTGAAGDTSRSRRLAELLAALPAVVHASEVEALRFDPVNTARRDLTELGLWLRDSQPSFVLSAEALAALGTLEPWWLAGAPMDGVLPGATLAWHLDLVFHQQQVGQDLIQSYGGGENGLLLFLKSQLGAIGAGQPLGLEEAEFLDRVLADAWIEAVQLGPTVTWPNWFQNEVLTFELANWGTLAGLPPPAGGAAPLLIGPGSCADGGALCTTPLQSYTHVVEPGAGGPMARSLLAPGTSEHAGPHELDQVALWEANATKPAPRTQAEVQASGPFTQTLLRYTAPPE